MFRLPLILLLIVFFNSIASSQSRIDSLLNDLQSKTSNGKIDSSALNTLEQLAEYYHLDDPKKTLEFSDKYLITARNYNDKKSIAHAYHYLGDYYRDEGLPVIAIDYYFSSLYLYEELLFEGAIAYTNIDIGNIYFDLGKKDVAKQYYEKVIAMTGDENVSKAKSVALNNIGLIYYNADEFRPALEKFEESLNLRKQLDDSSFIAHSYNYLGNVYTKLKELDSAEKYYNLALALYKKINSISEAGRVMMNIGKLYLEKSERQKSIQYRNDAIDLFMRNNKLYPAADAMTEVAEFHKSENNITEALKHSFKAYQISTENKYTAIRQHSLKLISDLYLAENNANEAYRYLKIYDDLKDSVSQQEAQRKIVNLEFSNELQRRDREMNEMKSENQLKELAIENQKRRNTLLLIITITVFILFIVIFFAFRIQRKSLKILQERNKIIDDNNKKIEMSMIMLEEAKEEAEKNARIKSEFLSIMSHELRTPMNAVLGMTQVIMEENPREDQLENLETIKLSAENLLDMINDILDYNRLESGKITLEVKDFSLRGLMTKLYKIFSFGIKKKGLVFNCHYDKDLMENFIGDEVRIGEIMSNLLSNAIKFTDSGSVTMEMTRVEGKTDSTVIRFTIKDTGIGINPEKLSTIFDSFTQEKSDTTRKYGGTGLGLSIVKKLLELMNGNISVKSKLGEGSEFYFELELKNSSVVFDSVKEPEPKYSFPNRGLKKILIVEDNNVNQLVMKKMLKNTGLEIDIADNGKLGFEKVLQNKYDLVFMDLLMPEMDGYDATRAIRKINQEVPIIALTADVMKGVEARTKEAGMNGYLSKPVKKEELLKTLSIYSGN